LLVNELEEIEKNVEPPAVAIALAINVFPVPGGPNSSKPDNTTHHHHNT
jgi:hypothetical protein